MPARDKVSPVAWNKGVGWQEKDGALLVGGGLGRVVERGAGNGEGVTASSESVMLMSAQL